jgi:uncharacterized protein RhaS with RHS repeats
LAYVLSRRIVTACLGKDLSSQLPGSHDAISGQRYYNPGTGRWLSRDPSDEQGGPNLYAYANNDPLDFYDLKGLRPIPFYFDAFINGNRGTWLPEPFSKVYYFKTDGRDFGQFSSAAGNARVYSYGVIESSDIGNASSTHGASAINDTGISSRKKLLGPSTWGPVESKKASLTSNQVTITDDPSCNKTVVQMTASASYPFILLSPDIDYSVSFTFQKMNDGTINVTVQGTRNKIEPTGQPKHGECQRAN